MSNDRVNVSIRYVDGEPLIHIGGSVDCLTVHDLVGVLGGGPEPMDALGTHVAVGLGQLLPIAVHDVMNDGSALNCEGGSSVIRDMSRVIGMLRRHLCNDIGCDVGGLGEGLECAECACSDKTWQMGVFVVPADVAHCKEIREHVKTMALAVGFDRHHLSDVLVAVGEAVTNAVDYGTRCGAGELYVTCFGISEKLCISVSDGGPGFDLALLPDLDEFPLAEHGRGIHCIRALMDEVSFDFECGTTVSMVRYAV